MREPSESSDSKRPGQQKDVQGVEESKSEPPAQQEKSDRISQAILAARIAERQKSTNIVTEWEPEERNPMSVVMIGSVVTGYEFTIAMCDTGCTAFSVCTREAMDYILQYFPESVSDLVAQITVFWWNHLNLVETAKDVTE